MVRFNGPVRASNPKELLADLKIIRVMIKSDVSTGAPGQGQGQGMPCPSQSAAVKSAMTLEVLQQLPNTVSVSFKGIRSYEVIDALSEKVRSSVSCSSWQVRSGSMFPLMPLHCDSRRWRALQGPPATRCT
jgi:hypothetical protein